MKSKLCYINFPKTQISFIEYILFMKYIKVFLSLVVILIAITPLLYGLYIYDWDINKFVMPKEYKAPEINIDYKVVGYEFYKDGLIIKMEIIDKSDIGFTLLNITGYVSTDSYSVPVRLLKQVTVNPHESSTVDIFVKPTDEFIYSLITQIINKKQFTLNLDTKIDVYVYGANVTIPLTMSRNIGLSELGISEEALKVVTFELSNINISDNVLVASFKVRNTLQEVGFPITLKILEIAGSITLSTGESSEIKLMKPVEIAPDVESKLDIGVALRENFVGALLQSLTTEGKVAITISGDITLSIFGKTFSIPFEETREITREELGFPEEIVSIEFSRYEVKENYVIMYYYVTNNLGNLNVDVDIIDIAGKITLPSGEETSVSLLSPVSLEAGVKKELGVVISLEGAFFGRLISDLISQGKVDLKLDVDVYLDVLGNRFIVPLHETLSVTREDLNLPAKPVDIEFTGFSTYENQIYIHISIYNNFVSQNLTITVKELSGTVSLDTGETTTISLIDEVTISAGEKREVIIAMDLNQDFLSALINKLLQYNETTLQINAITDIEVLGASIEVPITKSVIISKNEILPPDLISVEYLDLEFTSEYIIIYFRVYNNIVGGLNLNVSVLNITGVLAANNVSTEVYLLNPVDIVGSNATLPLVVTPNKEFVETLFSSLLEEGCVDIYLDIEAEVKVLDTITNVTVAYEKCLVINAFGFTTEYVSVEYHSIDIDADKILVTCSISNNLPLSIRLINVSGILTLGNASTEIVLDNEVSIDVNATEYVTLIAYLDEDFISSLIKQLVSTDKYNISITGTSIIGIYEGKVSYPINISRELSKEDLGIDPTNILVQVASYELTQFEFVVNISIHNPLPWDITITDANITLYYENGTPIAQFKAGTPITIKAYSNGTLTLSIDLTPELYSKLIKYIGTGKPFIMSGYIEVKVYNAVYNTEIYTEFVVSGGKRYE